MSTVVKATATRARAPSTYKLSEPLLKKCNHITIVRQDDGGILVVESGQPNKPLFRIFDRGQQLWTDAQVLLWLGYTLKEDH